MKELYIVIDSETKRILGFTGNLGTFYPMWDNPISANEWAQSRHQLIPYKVIPVKIDTTNGEPKLMT